MYLYQGGIENRFIPSLSKETKHLIEGFFKISNDENLRKYALSAPEECEMEEDDDILEKIIGTTVDAEFEDFADLAIKCLQ